MQFSNEVFDLMLGTYIKHNKNERIFGENMYRIKNQLHGNHRYMISHERDNMIRLRVKKNCWAIDISSFVWDWF